MAYGFKCFCAVVGFLALVPVPSQWEIVVEQSYSSGKPRREGGKGWAFSICFKDTPASVPFFY